MNVDLGVQIINSLILLGIIKCITNMIGPIYVYLPQFDGKHHVTTNPALAHSPNNTTQNPLSIL